MPQGDTKRKSIKSSTLAARRLPVVHLRQNRKKFIKEVIALSISRIKQNTINRTALIEELEMTLFREKLRISQNRWRVDPDDENDFWDSIKRDLLLLSTEEDTQGMEDDILEKIVGRYVNEISGKFNTSHYQLARSLVTFGFGRLLNASRVKGFSSLWSNKVKLQDKIQITGQTELIRKLASKGTVIMLPTHFSNLDSILIGWIIHSLGMPQFLYGAGLNLFNIGVIAYFMNSLGAYKIDRRKKNAIYTETLKSYSSLAMQKGCHTLFFPGGSRSRSGKIEDRLKQGLLSTILEAQRINFEKSANYGKKIFVVPVTLNYHFVLEAPVLINEYLAQKGQERYYIETDEYSTSYKITTFLLKFFTKGSDISVSIGQPRDVLGNLVDEEGNSIDQQGRKINTRDYFSSRGAINRDLQREEQYTKMLSDKLVEEYHKINRAFSSHIVAFCAFEIWKNKHRKLDLYNLLRLPEEELFIDYDEFCKVVATIKERIFELKKAGRIDTAPHLEEDLEHIVAHGIANVGMYHAKRPLLLSKTGKITTQDLNTLFYYHNRLEGYGLEKYI